MTPETKTLIVVVIADDVIRSTAINELKGSGFETIETKSGSQGLSAYMEYNPDLILMDISIPLNEGYEVIQAIRSFKQNQAIPILIMTEESNLSAMDHAFNVGATDFIIKSPRLEHLSQRAKYVLITSQTTQKLIDKQEKYDQAQKLAKLGYWEWDALKNEVTGSQMTFSLFGIPMQSGITLEQFLSHVLPKDMPLIHQAISEANQGQSRIEINFRASQLNNNPIHIECLAQAQFSENGNLIKISGSVQDITRLHKDTSQIQYQNQFDSLTLLPNRNRFYQTLTEFISDQKKPSMSAVIIFDIDRFKQVNITLGQESGDNLLRSIAQRLSRVIREADYAARLGSDEFAILVKNVHDLSELNLLMNRICHDLSQPFLLNYDDMFVSYSFGISVFPNDANDPEKLLNHANIARSTAKSQGGNQFVFFHHDMNIKAQDLLSLENDLRKALSRNQIEVFYQPQVDSKTLKATGSEALVRWNHPTQGIISPVVFIPLAESTGMIIEIGRYVLAQAIKQTEKWHEMGYNTLHIGINLSVRQFTQSNLMKDLQKIISQGNLPAQFIDLEITESLAMSDAETNINILNGLKALGVSLSIDDFGTGYSSLAYLHSFPVDTIKIDQSFVFNLNTSEGQAITHTILAMAESLELSVVAEGIELDEQADFFKDKHCGIFQGFKYGKPMPATQFQTWLSTQ
ncbi:MAG: hypothetical protein ISEC1_P1829 [Thiomicrorhabdus sp.]|nr:MAG: hypothetical protein ISEC1_P1829 [Thiomicrorhabdus sp.]